MSLTNINSESVKNELKKIKLIATDIDGTLTKNGQFNSKLLSNLETLKQRNILVLLITGRSAGWCQSLVNYLPVWGIIAENGGVYALKESQSMKPLTAINNIREHRQLLQNNFEEIKQKFPHLQPSSDNQFRITDWTFDCHECSQEELLTIEKICQEKKWGFTYSHIQGHLKPLNQNKANGLITLKETYFQELSYSEIMTVGDSPNDESLFDKNLFHITVGVANIAKYLDKLKHKPFYITNLSESDGFGEIVQLLVEKNNQKSNL
ncbi:MAG: HAD-IIB family hydrolase [Crocosphaera sp.]